VTLSKEFSSFVDLLRVVAALVVFLGHLAAPEYGAGWLAPFAAASHSAVIVFFVLSGYVITWSARRSAGGGDFAIDRAARIYSVAVPAVLLAYLLDTARLAFDPAAAVAVYQLTQPWKYLPLFLTFTNDFWFLNEDAFSIVPYWSLCYEVWYYVVFGLVFFGRGRWFRIVLPTLALAAMGPRLWLLFPIWLLGSAVDALHRRVRLPVGRARLLLAVGLIGMVLLKAGGAEAAIHSWLEAALGGFPDERLRYSRFVLGDASFAIFVGLVIFAARDAELTLLVRWRAPIKALASVSFSIYLTHYPLLLAAAALFPGSPVRIAAVTLLCVAIFGLVFERNKDVVRRILRSGLRRQQPAPG
jgi:peptidoglycan/LPS O-acetylase OafA/YrhL